jgi:LEA14-like dessication related protein
LIGKTSLKLFLAVAVLAGTGCQTLSQLDIRNPTYRFRDIRPDVQLAIPLSSSTIDVDMMVEIDNPNSVGLRLDRIDFDLFVNDRAVATSVAREGVRIPANDIGQVRLRTSIPYERLGSLFREVANVVQGGRANYEVRGTAYYDTPIGTMKFPLTVYRTGT